MDLIVNSLDFFLNNLNYWSITILMIIESSFIPFPSEIVVAPAAYMAAAGELNIILVIIFATIGADIGATINYALAYYLGRPIIYRFANSKWSKMCLMSQEQVEKSEKYFNNHGALATLSGRLMPGIRQLISIPAGLAKMNFSRFIVYTTLGAGIWNIVLATLGWYLHSFIPKNELNSTIKEYIGDINNVIIVIAIIVICFFVAMRMTKKKKTNNN